LLRDYALPAKGVKLLDLKNQINSSEDVESGNNVEKNFEI